MITWQNTTQGIDWTELEELFRQAPLANKSAARLSIAFGNSRFVWFVFEDKRLIGAGRALADGCDVSYLCDIAILPSHQGQGLGSEMVSRLLTDSQGHQKIILYAAPGKEDFYKRFGFLRLTTAMAIFVDRAGGIARGQLAAP